MTITIDVSPQFTKNNGDPATGLTLTDIDLTLIQIAKSDGTETAIWNTQNPDAEITGLGRYRKSYTGADLDANWYYAMAQYTGATALDADYLYGVFGSGMAEQVWEYATRTLTQATAQVVAGVTGSDIEALRGDTWSISPASLGPISNRTNLWFTIKTKKADADTAAIVQIDENNGLLYLNAAAGTAANGSITVDDASAGDITIALDEVETAKLVGAVKIFYDVQVIRSTGAVQTLTSGKFTISEDVTRATS